MQDIFTAFCRFQLFYLRLPKDIKDCRVILMDATVATGAAAMMVTRLVFCPSFIIYTK